MADTRREWAMKQGKRAAMAPIDGLDWLGEQTVATGRRTWSFLNWLTLDRLIPEGIAGQINYVIGLIPEALGIRGTTRQRQFASAVILIILAILASFLTFGLTLAVAAFFGVFALIALWRNNPWFNDKWRAFTRRLPIKNDYDIVGWARE